jgi:hypothetical protein
MSRCVLQFFEIRQISIFQNLLSAAYNPIWLKTSVAPVNVLILLDSDGFELLKKFLLVFLIILSVIWLDLPPSEIHRATLGPASVS